MYTRFLLFSIAMRCSHVWDILLFLSFYCQIIFHWVLLLPSVNIGHWDCLHVLYSLDYNIAFAPWTSIANPGPHSVKHNEIRPTDNYSLSCLPHQRREEMCMFPESLTLQSLHTITTDVESRLHHKALLSLSL